MKTPLFALALLSAMLAYGGHSQCSNPSLSWTIYQSYVDPATHMAYTSAIQGDSSSVYVDGTSGVIATLFLCDAETLDATLTLGNPRTASVSFSHPLALNSDTPSWAASGSTVTGTTAIDVRAMGYVPGVYTRSQEFAFTTRFNMSIPENGSWGLHLLNPNPSAPSDNPQGTVSIPRTLPSMMRWSMSSIALPPTTFQSVRSAPAAHPRRGSSGPTRP